MHLKVLVRKEPFGLYSRGSKLSPLLRHKTLELVRPFQYV